ncbi:hypothetical protein, partial [Aeromonas allosaccharophila]|uniref:hypothetical protein n=1 Tax=Aeromonas allosaccharophila TaxID=656 RepID=UPI002B49461B
VCDEQTECPWSACQKAPSVAVTWGWGSCGLMVDLGNNAHGETKNIRPTKPYFLMHKKEPRDKSRGSSE